MNVETWQVLVLAAVVLALYGIGVQLGAGESVFGLLVVAGFVLTGLALGRTIAERFL